MSDRPEMSPIAAGGGKPTGDDVPRRILVVLPNWVGDLVMATPAMRALRRRYPQAHIAYLLREPLRPILDGGDWMDEVIAWPAFKGLSLSRRREDLLSLARAIAAGKFDWAVLLTNSFRSAMLARLARIPRRIGYDRDGRKLLLTDRLTPLRANGRYVPSPVIPYYLAIMRHLGCPERPARLELFTTPAEEMIVDELLASARVETDQPVVVLHPGAAFGASKQWLPERFAEVGDQLAQAHGAAVFITCGPKEAEAVRGIAARMAAPVTPLVDPVRPIGAAKALVRRSHLLITNDTGPRHFANAFNVPVITLFGPTDQRWTWTDAPHERCLQIEVDCGPCQLRTCPLDHRCMTGLTTEMVMRHARELLADWRSRAWSQRARERVDGW